MHSEAEIYETILHTAAAAYKDMYHKDCVMELPFRTVMQGIEYGQEAVAGELMLYEWMKEGPWADFYKDADKWGHRQQALHALKICNDFMHHSL